MRRLVALLAVTVVLAGCWPQGPGLSAEACGPVGEPTTYLFGDSLGAWSKKAACERFAVPVSYNAFGGTQLDHWAEAMANVPPGSTVIVELGTNDVTNDLIADMTADLDGVLDLLEPAACVVVPTLNTTGGDLRGWPYDVRTRAFNDAVVAATLDHPDLRVVDWAAMSAGHPEWLVGTAEDPPDWVHHDAGTIPYAEMLAHAPEVCP